MLLGLLLGMALTMPPKKKASPNDFPALDSLSVVVNVEAPQINDGTAFVTAEHGEQMSLLGFDRMADIPDTLKRLRKLGIPDSLAHRILLDSMIRSIESGRYSTANFNAAWERVGTDGRNLISSVRLGALATCRPEEFLKVAGSGGMVIMADVDSALGGLASVSPLSAAMLLGKLRRAGVAASGGPLFESWGRGDPQGAMEACAGMTSDSEKNAALTSVYKGWMLKDLKSALSDWKKRGSADLGLQFGGDQKEWISELFWGAAKDSAGFRNSLDLISAVGEGDKAMIAAAGFAAMVAKDPELAVSEWKKLADAGWGKSDIGSPGSAAIAGLLEGLAWDSPQAAMDFLSSPESRTLLRSQGSGGFPFMFESMADLIVGAEPERAAGLVNDLQRQANHAQPETYISIELAKLAARQAEEGAMALLAGVENNWVRAQATADLLDTKAGDVTDPEGLLNLITRPEDRNEAAGRYVGSLVVTDFAAAAEWAATHDAQYPGSVKALVDGWARFDVAGATEMLAALAPEERQDLITDLAVGLTGSRPGVAVAWAASLTDGESRAAALAAVAGRASTNYIPVEDLLANQSLSPADQQLIAKAWAAAAEKNP